MGSLAPLKPAPIGSFVHAGNYHPLNAGRDTISGYAYWLNWSDGKHFPDNIHPDAPLSSAFFPKAAKKPSNNP